MALRVKDLQKHLIRKKINSKSCVGKNVQRQDNGLVVSSPPATEETGVMGREIESRQGVG
jgi:hypothetical protein